jgi:hypothetical protein
MTDFQNFATQLADLIENAACPDSLREHVMEWFVAERETLAGQITAADDANNIRKNLPHLLTHLKRIEENRDALKNILSEPK